MSRTSRRISRSLLAALAIVLVLGAFFTVHKLRKSHAAEAKATAVAVTPLVQPAPVTPAPPKQVASQSGPRGTNPLTASVPATQPSTAVKNDDDALITQTPTARESDNASRLDPQAHARVTSEVSSGADNSTSGADHESPDIGHSSWDRIVPAVEDTNANLAPTTNPTTTEPVVHETSAPLAHDAPPPVQTELSNAPLSDARTRIDSGDLIAARQTLNDALSSGRLGESDADAAKKQIEEINKTLVFSARKFPQDPWGGTYQVASGERLGSIANRNNVSWELLARINNITPKRLRSGQYIKIFKGPFHAVVYKRQFKMEIYLGSPGGPRSMYVTEFPVGLGKDDSTPTGLWMCKAGDKIRNPRYYPPRGGDIIAPEDPKNPLAGYWIALEGLDGQALGKESYGIHGTIEPDSIGKMASMGCIRLRHDDISWVFDLLVDGKSKVLVKD